MPLQIVKNSNCAEVKIKHGGTRNTVVIGNQISCDCSSLQMANCKTCHHIIWLLLNLMQVGEGNQLISQVMTEQISTIDNEDRNYDQMRQQHPLFNRNQTWYLEHNPTGTPCRCSGCLRPRIVQNNNLHFYVQGLRFLPKKQKVFDTKLH